MTRILFDHQIFSMQHYGGISRYFANIYQSLDRHADFEAEIGILSSHNYYIKDYPGLLNNPVAQFFLKKQSRAGKCNKIYSKYKIKESDFDILHPTYYHPYFLKYNRKPYVITVHDMIHELFSQFFDTADVSVKHKRQCIQNAAHIIAISESTKEDIVSVLGIEQERISVVHHGYNPLLKFPSDNAVPKKTANYVLFVGDRRGYKNFPKFVTAIAPLLQSSLKLKLICVGGGPFLIAETELLTRLGIHSQTEQRSTSDAELSALYKNALAFIYPSLYEGFGLPILEAFQNDCPVIGSNTKCFTEIGEDAMKYFDPHDEHDIFNTVKQVIDDNQISKILIENGRKQLLKFPMELCMEKTIEVYRKVAG